MNLYYPLASNQTSLIKESANKESLNAIALKAAEAIDEANQSSESWLNATEIFVYVTRTEFLNSNDVHHVDKSYLLNLKRFLQVVITMKNLNHTNITEITHLIKHLLNRISVIFYI